MRSKTFPTRADAIVAVVCVLFAVTCATAMYDATGRLMAFRLTCRANLGAMSKAMQVYTQDYDGCFPKAGARQNVWVSEIPDWTASSHEQAFGNATPDGIGKTTLTSNLYMLVRYSELSPRLFVCPGEPDTVEFLLSNEGTAIPDGFQVTAAWDFGPCDPNGQHRPTQHCSYSYHVPFRAYALTMESDPNMAVAADRNPWLTGTSIDTGRLSNFRPDIPPYNGTVDQARSGNSNAHQNDGQNVLFVDGHVNFQSRSFCGINNDNIYTRATSTTEVARGLMPTAFFVSDPYSKNDSCLVNDRPTACNTSPSSSK